MCSVSHTQFVGVRSSKLRVHKHVVSPTVVGAGCRVFGAGLADDVLMDLVPFILIVTPGEQQKTIMSYKG